MSETDSASTFSLVNRSRFSCRRFTDRPVPRKVVLKLLDEARWAPSGGNLQPWRFVVVERSAITASLATAGGGQSFLAQAPVVIAVCAVPAESAVQYRERGRRLYSIQDCAAATQTLLLAAAARGLGSCWIGAFDEERVAEILAVPGGWRPVTLVALGEPDEQAGSRRRRPLEEVTLWLPKQEA